VIVVGLESDNRLILLSKILTVIFNPDVNDSREPKLIPTAELIRVIKLGLIDEKIIQLTGELDETNLKGLVMIRH
jgi:hypothetical protein